MKRSPIKRVIAFVIAGLATAAAFSAVAGPHHDWNSKLALMSKDLPAFLSYHPTDGNPLRP